MGALTCEPANSSLLNDDVTRRKFAERDADDHAEENPDGQVTLEESETPRIYDFGFAICEFRHESAAFLPAADDGKVGFQNLF